LNFKYTIGCAVTPVSRVKPQQILNLIRDLDDPSVTLLLQYRRDPGSDFSARNYIEQYLLEDRVACIQYHRGTDMEDRRAECGIWIEKNTPPESLSSDALREKIAGLVSERMEISDGKRHALFFTGFHPYNNEGQAVYMRFWLSSLRKAGYEIHLVYYQNDLGRTPPEARSMAASDFAHYLEIPVTTRLAGRNENGLNVDVDDWCGEELCWMSFPASPGRSWFPLTAFRTATGKCWSRVIRRPGGFPSPVKGKGRLSSGPTWLQPSRKRKRNGSGLWLSGKER